MLPKAYWDALRRPREAVIADKVDKWYPGTDILIYDGEKNRYLSYEGYDIWLRNTGVLHALGF